MVLCMNAYLVVKASASYGVSISYRDLLIFFREIVIYGFHLFLLRVQVRIRLDDLNQQNEPYYYYCYFIVLMERVEYCVL